MLALLCEVNVNAWNAGLTLAGLALMAWWRSDGQQWWRTRTRRCAGCGRSKATCSCVEQEYTGWVFTPEEEDQ